ncbi:MAG: DMT family transporter [Pseudomonadota bacterium]|nr:hypothetical protein [Alphaproteobacteria bacterium]MEC7464754.1 DMT family transporter [Pseudomonadota bacterium]MEC8530937.1 DMT family transporter [Pseudomonadota bacterium]MEC8726007.1 DMT family transporter [Pseudomonadota bacterium]|tara:strand:+ start:1547 stop:2491 length:945 start_codon:yes stop_codon:yes gene_type:complete
MTEPAKPDVSENLSHGHLVAYLILALVALLWAANTILARATAEEIPPMALTFWRLFISALIFAPFALKNTWRHKSVVRQNFWLLNGLAFLSMAAFNGLVYLGLQYTVAINGNLLQGALPICIMLAGVFFARKKLTKCQCVGVTLGMFGLISIVIRGDVGLLAQIQINPGDALLFLGVFGSATYAVLLYKRPAKLNLVSFMFVTMVLATAQILPFFIVEHFLFRPMPISQTAILTVGFIALFPSVLAHAFFAEGVRRVGAAKAGYMIYLTPVFGVFMATAILEEPFRFYHGTGIALIASGIYLATFAGRQKTKTT